MLQKTTSMKDVAIKAGVSTATVSHVINNSSTVSDETRENVNKAIQSLNYHVNLTARKLRSGHSNLIGFIVSNLSHYFYHEIGSAIEDALSNTEYELVYINTHEDPDKEIKQIKTCDLEKFAGILIIPVNDDWKELGQFLTNTPTVFIDRKPQNIRRDTVLITNTLGSFDLTNELIKRGAKKFAFIATKYNITFQMRIDGFKDSLSQHNLPIDDDCIIFGKTQPKVYGQLANDSDWSDILDYLIQEKHVDCIITGNDLCAFGAISYFRKHKIELQKDILFGTFDNAFWMKNLSQEILAVQQDTKAIGETATNLLLSRINKKSFVYKDYLVETQVVSIKQNVTKIV
jgi:LacI family transcriptional regulator